MSGTSLDGIDVAICSFADGGNFSLVAVNTDPFPPQIQHDLHRIITKPECSLLRLGELDVTLGQLIGKSINALLKKYNIANKDIVAIGSHGQTVFHSPNGTFPFSMQIGDANSIAEITEITTISDFRQRDIAAGGQGAPLVPAFHHALFSNNDKARAIVNIGGISNITLLPASKKEDVIGFDTGPGNCLLDYWTTLHLNKDYDNQGQWAESGQYNEDLLSLFIDEPYFMQTIPKSTGRELFNPEWLENKLALYSNAISPVDVQTTLVEFTARTITKGITTYADSADTVYLCGGGTHNLFLFNRLQSLLVDKKLTTTLELGLDPDWVEACAFAWLAYRTINQKPGNITDVTGARHSVILGNTTVGTTCCVA